MAKVCSAAQSVDRDRHLGCGVCSESRSGTAPIPNRILREGTYRISSVEFREGILHTLSLRAAVTPNHPTKPSKRASTCWTHLIRVPVVRRGIDALPLVALEQLLAVPNAHGTADDLAHVGHQHIHLKRTTARPTQTKPGEDAPRSCLQLPQPVTALTDSVRRESSLQRCM